jgi:CPA2 family monovalent cation:H+ antiporter-2
VHGAHDFLAALAVVLCVAAVTTVVFQRLKQPVVLGYLIAGLIIGPHVPVPLVADGDIVRTLSELGVILLMFALGLEFRLKRLLEVGATAGITAIIQCSVMIWLGFVVGRVLGWTQLESLFCGAIIAISSTTIIAKAFEEQRVAGGLRTLVVGILIVEDLIAILLMTTLTAVASGSGLGPSEIAFTVGRLVAFLAGTLIVGILIVPRAMRFIVKLDRPETTLVASVGICFAVSLLALELGYSVALGAFLAGSLVAESGEGKRIEHLTQPVRDMFAAIFFVSVGMLIDPRMVMEHWVACVVLTVVVIVGKIVAVTVGAFLTGAGTRTAVQSGMSLAQIGEFSFIIATLGLTLKATGAHLFPIAVTVSAVTTLVTPFLIKHSGTAAVLLDRKLPKRVQTFTTLYARWIERLRTPSPPGERKVERRLVRFLVVDASLLTAVVIGAAVFGDAAAHAVASRLGLPDSLEDVIVVAATCALAIPLALGIVRVSGRLGIALATRVLPNGPDGRVDLAASPRRAFVVVLQLASVALVGAPVLAVTQPFLTGFVGAALFGLVLCVLAFVFWRRANDLHGHVRAGADVIVTALAKGVSADDSDEPHGDKPASDEPDGDEPHGDEPHGDEPHGDEPHGDDGARALVLQQVELGLGEPELIELNDASAAAGRSLASLDLRGNTGASVLVVRRAGNTFVPIASEPLRAGDVLVVSGTRDAVAAARAILLGARSVPAAEPATEPATEPADEAPITVVS